MIILMEKIHVNMAFKTVKDSFRAKQCFWEKIVLFFGVNKRYILHYLRQEIRKKIKT